MAINNQRIGTGFTNIGRVLAANQGNRLGQTVGGRIQEAGSRAQSDVSQAKNVYSQQVEEAQKNLRASKADAEDVISRINQQAQRKVGFSDPRSSTDEAGILQTSTPFTYQPTEDDVERFRKIREGIYQGPQGIQNIEGLRSSTQRAQNLGELSKTQSGRQELLRQTFASPTYRGKLDALLLAKQRNNDLANARQQVQGVGQEFQDLQTQAGLQKQALDVTAKKYGQDITSLLQGSQGIGGIDAAVKSQLEQAQNIEKARQGDIEAIQRFANNQEYETNLTDEMKRIGYKESTDQYGNKIIKDPSGNPVYKKARTGSVGEQLDSLAQLLKSRGVSQESINQMIGSGNFAKTLAQYQPNIDLYHRARSAAENFWGSADEDKIGLFKQAGLSMPEYGWNQWISWGRNRDPASYIGQQKINEARDKAKAYLDENLYGKLGVAGQMLSKEQDPDKFFYNLSKVTAGTKPAEGLTETGVATEQQRASYDALNKLLGAVPDSRYSQIDPATGKPYEYKKGNLWFSPEDIKNMSNY